MTEIAMGQECPFSPEDSAEYGNRPPPDEALELEGRGWRVQDQAPNLVRVLSEDEVENFAADIPRLAFSHSERQRLTALVKKIREQGALRPVLHANPGWKDALADLGRSFPNFSEVLDYARAMFGLAERADRGVHLGSLIIESTPGTGKSLFCEQFAARMGFPLRRIDMAAAQCGARLGGSESFWENSQPGVPFEMLALGMHGGYANGILHLDELCKAHNELRHSPVGALYELMEPATARTFRDLSVPAIGLDASGLNFLCTVNDAHLVPAPILSRARVFHVRAPSPEVMREILRGMYREAARQILGSEEEASDEIVERLARVPPRTARLALREAFGRALASGRHTPTACDLPSLEAHRGRASIGFVGGLR